MLDTKAKQQPIRIGPQVPQDPRVYIIPPQLSESSHVPEFTSFQGAFDGVCEPSLRNSGKLASSLSLSEP